MSTQQKSIEWDECSELHGEASGRLPRGLTSNHPAVACLPGFPPQGQDHSCPYQLRQLLQSHVSIVPTRKTAGPGCQSWDPRGRAEVTDTSRLLLVTARVPPAGGTACKAPLWAPGVKRLLGWEDTSQPEASGCLIPCPDNPI